MNTKLRFAVSCLAWPVLLVSCLAGTAYGFSVGHQVIAFNVIYFSLAACLFMLERKMPHEQEWMPSDGQTLANIAHTLMSKGTVQTLIVFSSAIGLASYITPMSEPGHGIWPRDWPLWAQIILGIYVSEFALYWSHRIAHEIPFFWKFHAIHHSVTKLWIINTGRFHFIDSLKSVVMGMTVLLLVGAPMEVLTWLSAITAYVGILTHCNVEMRFGPLSYVFNTPGLHRWHHSRDLREGNMNYGENVVLWDMLFGTWFNENRRPPANIGISEQMPSRFIEQLAWPFRNMKNNNQPEAAE